MIPYKIYIPLYPNLDTDGFHLGDDWMETPDSYSKCEHAEYIRKEAFLEWANKRLEEFRHIAEISNDVAADGEVDAFEELIEKLNEM